MSESEDGRRAVAYGSGSASRMPIAVTAGAACEPGPCSLAMESFVPAPAVGLVHQSELRWAGVQSPRSDASGHFVPGSRLQSTLLAVI
jgi:hypothetical protein